VHGDERGVSAFDAVVVAARRRRRRGGVVDGSEKKDEKDWEREGWCNVTSVWNEEGSYRMEVGLEWKGAFDSMVCW
jgi:hypothetical protein